MWKRSFSFTCRCWPYMRYDKVCIKNCIIFFCIFFKKLPGLCLSILERCASKRLWLVWVKIPEWLHPVKIVVGLWLGYLSKYKALQLSIPNDTNLLLFKTCFHHSRKLKIGTNQIRPLSASLILKHNARKRIPISWSVCSERIDYIDYK